MRAIDSDTSGEKLARVCCMPNRNAILLLFGVFAVNACSGQDKPSNPSPSVSDKEAALSLPWGRFDQGEDSGWRLYAARKQHLEAARLIEAYLARHNGLTERQRALSQFHAGMQYVFEARDNGGDFHAAIPHLDLAIVSGTGTGLSADWNDMVTSIKAFLLGDKATLLEVQKRVEAMPPETLRWLKPPDSAADYINNIGKPYGSWWPKEDPKK
jgi:hypothetical protein